MGCRTGFYVIFNFDCTSRDVLDIITKTGRDVLMVRLRILDILEEQNHTKYWLYKQMDLSYQNFNKMVMNETKSIRFDNLDKLSQILNCPIGDLFEIIEEDMY